MFRDSLASLAASLCVLIGLSGVGALLTLGAASVTGTASGYHSPMA